MRVVQPLQMALGEVEISNIKLDIKSRDDIPKILKGLQFIYMQTELRMAIFDLLNRQISPKVSKTNGRPGMDLWTIFVCGVIRLILNIDYDRLHELVNHHNTLREMLGHVAFDDVSYNLQTLKDNISLLTPELLDEINQLIVKSGHDLVFDSKKGKKKDEPVLRGRCDSFVVETDVHYPTDTNLLFDATRKIIQLTAKLSKLLGLSDWRQHNNNVNEPSQGRDAKSATEKAIKSQG